MQDPLANYSVEQLAKLPPDQAEALYYQAAEYRRRQQEQQRAQAEKDARGSTSNDLINTGAGLAGTIGGLYAANSILAPSTAATTGAGAVGAGAATGAVGGSVPAAPVLAGGGQVAGGVGASAPFLGIGALPAAGIAAGVGLGAREIYNLVKGKDDKSPVGLLGRGTLGIATGGLSEVGRALGLLGRKTTKQHQQDRDRKLAKKVSSYGDFSRQLQAGREAENRASMQAAPDFVGKDDSGTWVNNRFKNSNDVKDLRAEDIWGAQSFFEKHGDDWLGKMTEEQRRAEAQRALDLGAVSLSKGMTNVDWNKMGQPQDPRPASSITDRISQMASKPNSGPSLESLGVDPSQIRTLPALAGRDFPMGSNLSLGGMTGRISQMVQPNQKDKLSILQKALAGMR